MRRAVLLCLTLSLAAAPARGGQPFDGGPLPTEGWLRLGSPRFVHDSPVCCVALSPDGKWLACGTDELLFSTLRALRNTFPSA